jgi:hypothetical protein
VLEADLCQSEQDEVQAGTLVEGMLSRSIK